MISLYFLLIPLITFLDKKYFDLKYSDFIYTIFSVLSLIFLFANSSFGFEVLQTRTIDIYITILFFFIKGSINLLNILKQKSPLHFSSKEFFSASILSLNFIEFKAAVLLFFIVPRLVERNHTIIKIDKENLFFVISLSALMSGIVGSEYIVLICLVGLNYFCFSPRYSMTTFYKVALLTSLASTSVQPWWVVGFALLIPFGKLVFQLIGFDLKAKLQKKNLLTETISRLMTFYLVIESQYLNLDFSETVSSPFSKRSSESKNIADKSFDNRYYELVFFLLLVISAILLGGHFDL